MGASLKDAPSAWCLLLLSMLLGVDILFGKPQRYLLSFMRTTLSATLTMLTPYLPQPTTRSLMLKLWDRRVLPVSAHF